MRRHRLTRLLVMTASLSTPLLAQGPGGFGPPPFGQGPPRMPGPGMEVLSVGPLERGEPVLGQPFTAEVVTEMLQELTDGNRIEHRTTGLIARDGRGRIRRELSLPPLGPMVPEPDARVVTIVDPAAGVQYFLNAARKTAVQSRLRPNGRRGGPPGAPGVPGAQGRPRRPAEREGPDVRTEQLASRTIDGLQVEGTRTTMTIPSGARGNTLPIGIVTEQWFSPELRTIVASRRVDPLMGTVDYRLVNIVRGEPAAEWFQVPPDYTVTDGPPRPR